MRFDKETGEPKLPFIWTVLAGFVLWAIGSVPFIIAYQIWSTGGGYQ